MAELINAGDVVDPADRMELAAIADNDVDAKRKQSRDSQSDIHAPLLDNSALRSDGNDTAVGLATTTFERPCFQAALLIAGEVLETSLLAADVLSDLVLMVQAFTVGVWLFGVASAILLVNQYASYDKIIHTLMIRKADSTAALCCHLLCGFPFAPLLLDALLVLQPLLEPLGALQLLPVVLGAEAALVVEDLLRQYKSVRLLPIGCGPQAALQGILLGYMAYCWHRADDAPDERVDRVDEEAVPLTTLLLSLALSVISVLKAGLVAWRSSLTLEEVVMRLSACSSSSPRVSLRQDEHPCSPMISPRLSARTGGPSTTEPASPLGGRVDDRADDGPMGEAPAVSAPPAVLSARAHDDHAQTGGDAPAQQLVAAGGSSGAKQASSPVARRPPPAVSSRRSSPAGRRAGLALTSPASLAAVAIAAVEQEKVDPDRELQSDLSREEVYAHTNASCHTHAAQRAVDPRMGCLQRMRRACDPDTAKSSCSDCGERR